MNIQEFRQQYPQYNNIGDDDLAQALHQKYYQNVPYDEFRGRFIPKPSRWEGVPSVPSDMFPDPAGEQVKPVEMFGDIENRRRFMEYARPTLEAGASIGGGLIGTAGAPGPGTVAGGGLGYLIGNQAADRLEEWLGLTEKQNIKEISLDLLNKELPLAMAGELAPLAVFKAGGKIYKYLLDEKQSKWMLTKVADSESQWVLKEAERSKISKVIKDIRDKAPTSNPQAIKEKVGELLARMRKGPYTKVHEEQIDQIMRELGISEKPTFATRTGSVEAARMEQAAVSQYPEVGDAAKMKQARIMEQADRGLAAPQVGTERIGDTRTAVRNIVNRLERQTGEAQNKLLRELSEFDNELSVYDLGTQERDAILSAKAGHMAASKSNFDAIDETIRVSASPARSGIAGYIKDTGLTKSTPNKIVSNLKEVIKEGDGEVTYGQLKAFKEQLQDEINVAWDRGKSTEALRLTEVQNSVKETINQLEGISDAYANAVKYHAENVAPFKTPGSALLAMTERTGPRSFKMMPEKIPEAMLTGGIDNIKAIQRAVGKDVAKDYVESYIGHELVQAAYNPKTGLIDATKASKLIGKHKWALKQYGLYNKFSKISKNIDSLSDFMAYKKNYEKEYVAALLGVNPKQAIKSVFSGQNKKNSIETMKRLLNVKGIKNNQKARRGLQNEFVEFFRSEIASTELSADPNAYNKLVGKAVRFLNEWDGALKVLYKDNPAQLRALKNYTKLLEFVTKPTKISRTGGSNTVEKLMGVLPTMNKDSLVWKFLQWQAVRFGKGWTFNTLRSLIKSIADYPYKIQAEEMEALMKDAITDPELAQTLMDAANSKIKQASFNQRLHAWYIGSRQATTAPATRAVLQQTLFEEPSERGR